MYGPRQVGKTTLTKSIQQHFSTKKTLVINGDDLDIQDSWKASVQFLTAATYEYNLIIIDEAQRITNIWLIIKILVDNFPQKQIIATGSSSFDLANKIVEPLTGRALMYHLYPLSLQEIYPHEPLTSSVLSQRMLYGSYPDVVVPKILWPESYLKSLVDNYLYKDIISFDGIKKSSLIIKILQALALQISNEFSYFEIANLVGADKSTVEKYIRILEQAFIIKLLHPLHNNQRREIKSNKKVYFRDLWVRNALIGNFKPLNMRQDVGALRENLFIIERIKYQSYRQALCNNYFWREVEGKEIDFVEVYNDFYECFECKYSIKKSTSIPTNFAHYYKDHDFHIVHSENIANRVR